MKTYEREALIRRLQLAAADLLESAKFFEKGNDSMGKLCAAQGESWVQSANNVFSPPISVSAQEEYFEKWGYVTPC